MKINYLYQQLGSHVGVVVISFLIVSLVFTHFIENLVYDNKADELMAYGNNILEDLEQNRDVGSSQILGQYGHVLAGRDIQYSLFNEASQITFSTGSGATIRLQKDEWQQIKDGYTVVMKQDFKRFNEGVTFVLMPYHHNQQFVGGILLASPIKGSREVISQIKRLLFYTVLIAAVVALLLSWLLAKFQVKRIKRLQEGTSLVAGGDYSVRIPSSDFDEIGELSQDFNHMVEKLHASMEEIESLENRRRQFMADVSHELRTPLTTIRGVIEGIQTGMIPESERDKAMQLVTKETRRLIRLVNENLDYEKIRSNQVQLYIEDLQLSEVFEIIKEQLDLLAEEKGNKLAIEVKDHTHIWADYDRLTQILINIIKNSIQFTEDGTITMRGWEEPNTTVIEIEDTGIGMDAEEVNKIWDRFYKAMVSRTTNPYGEFGLGLSIVKQLVILHQGTIDITSEKGKGTIFTLRFPQRAN